MKRLHRLSNPKLQRLVADKDPHQNTPTRNRLLVMVSIFGLFVLLIVGRLFQLQVVQGAEYRLKSDNNRIYVRKIPAARGIITDTQGRPLVTNQPVYRLLTDDYNRLSLDPQIVDRDLALKIEATQSGRVIQSVGRYYPYATSIAHVIGYVAEADTFDLESGYINPGEMTGKAGVERYFNQMLTGESGSELIELDAQGRLLRRVGQYEPRPGRDIQLHLDLELQQISEQVLEGYTGSVVVTNPKTGAVLAMSSNPSYDPNMFGYEPRVLGIDSQTNRNQMVTQYLSDPDQPMLNRAIAGVYPPGSVYKIVPSIAGLEDGVITPRTEIEDTGQIVIDDFRFRNWFFTQYGGTDGMVDLSLALQRSNDVYYYRLGERVGIDSIADWSRLFGLGEPTGINLYGEARGLVPDRLWKERVKNERWFLGNTYHVSIGQGDLLTSPLQVNQMMAVIANQGRWCRPQLVKTLDGELQDRVECRELGIEPEHIQAVEDGLVAACLPRGTGAPFFSYSLHELNSRFAESDQVACKTGTAQYDNPNNHTHAWFTIYAPAENPEIMITVMMEGAGEGSQEAAPAAKVILDYWAENLANEAQN